MVQCSRPVGVRSTRLAARHQCGRACFVPSFRQALAWLWPRGQSVDGDDHRAERLYILRGPQHRFRRTCAAGRIESGHHADRPDRAGQAGSGLPEKNIGQRLVDSEALSSCTVPRSAGPSEHYHRTWPGHIASCDTEFPKFNARPEAPRREGPRAFRQPRLPPCHCMCNSDRCRRVHVDWRGGTCRDHIRHMAVPHGKDSSLRLHAAR